jgi:hypothetical protein
MLFRSICQILRVSPLQGLTSFLCASPQRELMAWSSWSSHGLSSPSMGFWRILCHLVLLQRLPVGLWYYNLVVLVLIWQFREIKTLCCYCYFLQILLRALKINFICITSHIYSGLAFYYCLCSLLLNNFKFFSL